MMKTDELWKVLKFHQQLKIKLGKEFIKIVEIILTNFEELYQSEWDLQQQIKEKELVNERKEELTITRKLIEENVRNIKQFNK